MRARTCGHVNCSRGRLLGVPPTARMTAAAEAALTAGGYNGAAKQNALSLVSALRQEAARTCDGSIRKHFFGQTSTQ